MTTKRKPDPKHPTRQKQNKPEPPDEDLVKPVVPPEQSLIESHQSPTMPDLKPIGE